MFAGVDDESIECESVSRNTRLATNRPSYKVRCQLQKVISEGDFRKLDDVAAIASATILLRDVLRDLSMDLRSMATHDSSVRPTRILANPDLG